MGRMMAEFLTDDVLARVEQLLPIAAGLGISMPQLALAWVLREENVASAIVGASRPEQVHQNASASGIELDAETLAQIDAILA
jgi:aryl-alcohol dehydrogenase-like predicted oxidoreductase